jgi:hypothetical protein
MLPGYLMKKKATIWNLVARGATTKDILQRTVLDKVYFTVKEERVLGNDGNFRKAEVMTLFIDMTISTASGDRQYIPHEQFDAAYKADPGSIGAYWTIRPGFDVIGVGEILDTEPSTGSAANNFGGRKDYKVTGMETKEALDARQFIKVVAL